MGLTADLENKWLYWLVRSYDGSELHRAPTADQITHGINEVSTLLLIIQCHKLVLFPTKPNVKLF